MAIPQELTDALAKLDTETTGLATVVTQLRDMIKTGMTPEDVAVVRGNLDAVAERLKGIAHDPNAPIPPEPPVVFARNRRG